MFVHLRCAAFLFLLLFCSLAFPADQPKTKDLPEVPMKPIAVAAFKNGIAFFLKQGSGSLANGEGLILNVPHATLGSLWVAPTDPGSALEELVAYQYPTKMTHPAASLSEMLRANVGKTATVRFGDKEYTGQVFAADSSNLLLLKADGKSIALNLESVSSASIVDPNLSIPANEQKNAFRFRLKGVSDNAHLAMGFIQRGVGWTPSYLVNLKDDKTAQMTMQAVLVNDVEDLHDVDVFFVVGAPNFAYAGFASPMAFDSSGSQIPGVESQMLSNMMSNSGPSRSLEIADESMREALGTTNLSGSAEQDMFLYNLPKITLNKGERGLYNVFAAEVAYEHLYEWTVGETDSVDVYGERQSRSSDDKAAKDVVWHSLVLRNSTRYPWTSAPTMILSGEKPVAQDTLRYTPKGAPGIVRLTVASDVRVGKKEAELERKSNSAKFFDNNYDVVTVEGLLKLTNHKQQPIKLKVTQSLIGTVISAGDNPHIEKTAEELRGVNPRSRVTWDLMLTPGIEKKVSYKYQVYVRD